MTQGKKKKDKELVKWCGQAMSKKIKKKWGWVRRLKKKKNPLGGVGEEWNRWGKLKVQTSSYSINESQGWNVQHREYGQ